jgi:hypothetical protein
MYEFGMIKFKFDKLENERLDDAYNNVTANFKKDKKAQQNLAYLKDSLDRFYNIIFD